MPQYMLILGGTDKAKVMANREITMKRYAEWTELLVKNQHFKDAHKLKDGDGRRITFKNDKAVDGPFSETKETVGGYYIIEAKSYEEAVALGKSCPVLEFQGGYVEVREIER
jgi:hypothetical protein